MAEPGSLQDRSAHRVRRNGGTWTSIHAFMVDHAKGVLAAFVGSVLLVAVAWAQGVFLAPAKVAALTTQVARLDTAYADLKAEVSDVAVATWTFVALDCLRMNDSTFVTSRLPCGKAFQRSGVSRRLTR